MKSTRIGSSYKEEILRFVHAKPNGIFTDDRIGVTSAVANALQLAGLPVSVSTVSSSVHVLRNEGRLTVTYGHRSLDNHLLIVGITVHAEPHDGVATGPSEPLLERDHELRTRDNDDLALQMLRRLIRLMEGQPTIDTVEIERFRAHVDHLIDENQTWEALAQEAEDGFTETINDLRRQSDQRDAEHQATLQKSESRASMLRDRAERYRLEKEAARGEVQSARLELDTLAFEHERELCDLREQLDRRNEKVASLQKANVEQRESIDRISELRASMADVSVRREDHLITELIFPPLQFIFNLFMMFDTLNRGGVPVRIDDDVIMSLGMLDKEGNLTSYIDSRPETLRSALSTIATKHHAVTIQDRRKKSAFSLVNFIRMVQTELDEKIGALPPRT